jgi:hypothetical protein
MLRDNLQANRKPSSRMKIMASPGSSGSITARRIPDFLPNNRLFRVEFDRTAIRFVCIGGPRTYGIPGLIESWTRSGNEHNRSKPLDRGTDRSGENFNAEIADIVLSAIETTWMHSLLPGNLSCWWRLKLTNRRTVIFKFDTIDELTAAVKQLPKFIHEKHANRVRWNAKRRKFVPARGDIGVGSNQTAIGLEYRPKSEPPLIVPDTDCPRDEVQVNSY